MSCFRLCLGIFSGNGHGQLILAGDPKQLGPILRSPIALKFGLQLSLLERLMANPVYGRGEIGTFLLQFWGFYG